MDCTHQVRRSIPLPSMGRLHFLNFAFDKTLHKKCIFRVAICSNNLIYDRGGRLKKQQQNATRKINHELITIKNGYPDTISFWIEAYLRFEVTTSKSSQKVQKRDLALFRDFMIDDCGREDRSMWNPRLSKGRGGYSERTTNRIMAHLKTLAKWIHKLKPFPLGNPMAKMKLMPIGNGLEIERAISPAERRRILDAADTLPIVGGRSKDRHRFRDKERSMREGCRPFCNRAIVYTLIETGMRRAVVRNIDLADVDFERRLINVKEKGGMTHGYKISREGISAIEDYVAKERTVDFKKWKSPVLFL
jgi:integrase